MSEPRSLPSSPMSSASQRWATIQAFRQEVSLFKYLSPIECQVMYSLSLPRHYEAGQRILHEGSPATGLHVVESGQVVVSQRRRHGKSVVLGTIEPFGHFGEMSILDAQPADCSVDAVGPVDVLVMSRTEFSNLLHRSEGLGLRLLRALCEELSNRLRWHNQEHGCQEHG